MRAKNSKNNVQENNISFDKMKEGFKRNNKVALDALAEKARAEAQAAKEKEAADNTPERKTAAKVGSAKLKAPKKVTKKVYETGISQNYFNGERVVSILKKFGAGWIPSNPALLVVNLEAKNAQAWAFLTAVIDAKQVRKNAITFRQDVYKNLRSHARRILNELIASGAPTSVVDNARHFVDKIEGHRIIKIKPNDTNQNHISASQTSYTQQIPHFNGLIGVLKACAEYNPNVPELKVTALEEKRDNMMLSNTEFWDAETDYNAALSERNEFMNAEQTGYVATYGAVKRAAKAIYGNRSEQYKQMSGIAFKKVQK